METTNNSNEKTMEEIKVTKMTLIATTKKTAKKQKKNRKKQKQKQKHERAVGKKEHCLLSLS